MGTKSKEPPIIRVEWMDSTFLTQGWVDADTMEVKNPITLSVGFKAKETKDWLYLSLSWAGGEQTLEFGGALAIPKRCIVKRSVLGV